MGLISVLFSQNNIVLQTKGYYQDSLKYRIVAFPDAQNALMPDSPV